MRKDLHIVYNDENITVVNKPAGIPTEGAGSMAEELNAFLAGTNERAAACHRLDTNTAGLIVFAKNKIAESEITSAIKEERIDKFYRAKLKGVPKKKDAVLKAYLFKDSKKSTVYVYGEFKKGCVPIETRYKIIRTEGTNSVAEILLRSGKTHQIRAHMAFIGHPILGDGKYGDFALNKKLNLKKQELIAMRIVFHFSESSPLAYLDKKEIALF